MDTDELIKHATAMRERIQRYGRDKPNHAPAEAAKAQVCEFLRTYAGAKSAFLKQAEAARGVDTYQLQMLTGIIQSYVEYLETGLAGGVPPERKAQIDVVSDILAQAEAMLENSAFHPAAPAVLIGASLEEFLRTWIEAEGLSMGNAKPGLDAYCKALRGVEMLTKQDVKDITSWAGIRNHAAHGEWDEVADRGRVRLMLEGVNLFLRQKMPPA